MKYSIYIKILLLFAISVNLSAQVTSEGLPSLIEIEQKMVKQGFQHSDIVEMKRTDHYYSASMDMYHTYYQQFIYDIPVENALLNIATKKGDIKNLNHSFVNNIRMDPLMINSAIAAKEGLVGAMKAIDIDGLAIPHQTNKSENSRNISSRFEFDKGQISRKNINVSLIWIRDGKSLRLCWESIIEPTDSQNELYYIFVDAQSGEYLKKYNRILECNFDGIGEVPSEISYTNDISHLSIVGGYDVFDLPVESPSHGNRTVTTDPWERSGIGNMASTLGWHNDGSNAYTITRGNNVHAYEDQNGNNAIGYSPNGGAMLDFQFPLNFANSPVSNRDAAITNLFHTSNLVHDVMYQYGFDEAAGNYQTDNLGRGGNGNDHVLAEALDGSGINNANFSITADGTNGRMQMFLWNAVPPPSIDVNSGGSLSPSLDGIESAFSSNNKLTDVGPVTGDVTMALPINACLALTNPVPMMGKIALIDRGGCDFTTKVKNAQNAGAIAAIVVNNVPLDNPFSMGGVDNTINIPAVMISNEDGQLIKNEIVANTVNITLTGFGVTELDGCYDNGIVVHEYGHGISTRLTGGPASPGCLQNEEQMGEGWSDFFMLMMATDWASASGLDARGLGTYVIGEPINGVGIRTFPYTTDVLVNPFTYADMPAAPLLMSGNVSPHYVGSIWATMLWEMTWSIIDIEGIDTDIYHGTGGNNIALQLVTDGLKLQPCLPGFVEGRDAILLADELRYGGIHKCAIWEAFAKRGLGVSADQGSFDDHTDGTAAFDLPDSIKYSTTFDAQKAFEGQTIEIVSEAVCGCVTKTNYQIKEMIPPGTKLLTISEGTQSANEVVSSITNLNPLDTIRIIYTVRAEICSGMDPILQLMDDVEGSDHFTSIKLAGNGNIKWDKDLGLSNSPSTSWYAEDYDVTSEIALTQDNQLLITGPTLLEFYHRFNTEATWDGGVVELSTNNDGSWVDVGDLMIQNGYPSQFSVNSAASISGKPAFTGNGDVLFGTSNFVKTVVDLCKYIGQNVKIRFRFLSDSNTSGSGINGWYVDDIAFRNISAVQTTLQGFDDGVFQDDLVKCLEVLKYQSSVVHVDDSAEGLRYGGTWDDAFLSLTDALDLVGCRNIDTVQIAQGVYLPSNHRDSSFFLPSNVTILGGFPSGGGTLASRNPTGNETILSGDVGVENNITDNVYHVVHNQTGGMNTILDGIIIEEGNANGAGIDSTGAGILNLGMLRLKNVVVRNNVGTSKVMNMSSGHIFIDEKVNIDD